MRGARARGGGGAMGRRGVEKIGFGGSVHAVPK